MDKKQIRGIVIGAICFAAAYVFVQQVVFKPPRIDKQLMKMASEANANCPFMIDSITRWDNAMAMDERTLQYNYTVDVCRDSIDIAYFTDILSAQITNHVRTSPDMKYLREKKVTFVYNYKDIDGVFITKIEVTPDKYKE